MFGSEIILTKKYILYKIGISTSSVEHFFIKNNVDYIIVLEEEYQLDEKYDYVVKSPSVPLHDKFIINCRRLNIKVISDLELFYLLYKDNYFVCVTGTNGKTSVINNIHQLLIKLGISHYYIGNMGNPIFDIASKEIKNKIILIECSSYMLESTFYFKPNIYIVTNLGNHHIEHHKTRKKYYNAKLKIIKRMRNGIIINQSNLKRVNLLVKNRKNEAFGLHIVKNHFEIDRYKFNINNLMKFPIFDIKNLLSSLLVVYKITEQNNINIDLYKIFDFLEELEKYPFRYEKIVDNNDYIIYNDSKSTNIEAGISALSEMNRKYDSYYLIIGGVDQNQNFAKLKKYLKKVKVLYVYGENKNRIYRLLKKYANIKRYDTVEEIVNDINENGNEKKVILYSPMSTSFDQFKNFEERGEYFNKLINCKL